MTERHALEVERAELANDLVRYQAELDAMTVAAKAQRELRAWQVRRAQRRIADLEDRLAVISATD